MNKVEQLIIEAIQQSLSALDRIDVAALQGRCTPFADERCRLDNLPTLLRHCKRYYEASLRNDTEQVMQSRRDINVYTHTMGFTPEGNDSLLKLLSGEGEKIPSPPPPPPPSPLPPINPGGGGHLPPQKSKISPFVLGLVAIAVCFVLGLVWILNQEPSKPTPEAIPTPRFVVDTEPIPQPSEKETDYNMRLINGAIREFDKGMTSRYFAYIELPPQNGKKLSCIKYRIGRVQIVDQDQEPIYDIEVEHPYYKGTQENGRGDNTTLLGEVIAKINDDKRTVEKEYIYVYNLGDWDLKIPDNINEITRKEVLSSHKWGGLSVAMHRAKLENK